MSISPTAEGFRATFRRPALTLAEIVWRWTAGGTAAALLIFSLVEYLDTLPVTNGELLFLRTRHPYLVGEAIAHIFRGSLNRVVVAGLLAAFMLAGVWIIAASVGRIATVRGLVEYFREHLADKASAGGIPNDDVRDGASGFSANALLPAVLRLNFLRAAVAFAAIFGFAGASILAGFASPAANPQPGLAFLLFLPGAGLIGCVWWSLNWLLSLAAVFAIRDREDAVGAISAAVTFCRQRIGSVSAVSTWTGLAHLIAFVGASVASSLPLGFVGAVPWRLVALAVIFVTLAYLAVADWLYLARLAGYVCILEMPEAVLAPLPPAPVPPALVAGPPVQTTIDRDEPILSDLPNLAVET
jgi:hypothetical protein